MSNQQNAHLQPGEYYGSVARRRQLSGLVLSELKHAQPRALPQHSHEFGFFSFLLKGDYEEWYGKQTITHQPMTLMWHPPTLTHQDRVGRRGCHFFNAEVSSDWLNRLQDYTAIVSSPQVLRRTESGWLMMRLYREFSATNEGSELALEGLLLELLATLARRQEPVERQRPIWLRRVESRLRDEFTEKPTMTELAAEAGVHPAHLAVVFRRFHHTTVSEFAHQLRVRAACEMMQKAETSLAEIALNLGFADQSHFSRVFHRVTGMTPKAWRATVANRAESLS